MQRRRNRLIVAVAALLAATPLALVNPLAAQAEGIVGVGVSPYKGLAGGDVVKVWASGLPRATQVRVVQCDTFDNPDEVCPDAAIVTTSRYGTLYLKITLRDPLIRSEPAGSGSALYCRADQCRIGLLTFPDENNEVQVLGVSRRLLFKGSPATVTATPSTDLAARQWIRVRGTAYGGEGRAVRIVEQNCYVLIQETGCYAAARPVWTQVRYDGTFSVPYLARRFLFDGESVVDCNDTFNILGDCVVSATIYNRDGTPDRTFGIPSFGQPMALLRFRDGP